MKNIFKAILLILTLTASFSCKKELELPSDPYVTLGDGIVSDAITFDYKGTVYSGSTIIAKEEAYAITGQCPRVDILSNLPKWKIEPVNAKDSEWLFFWPSSGEECGKFFVSADRNQRAESRSAAINITDHNGKVWKTFKIFQTGSSPVLSLDMGGISEFNLASEKGSLKIKLNTNAQWKICEDAPSWMSFSDFADASFTVNCEANAEDAQRSATFTVQCSDPAYSEVTANFTISQRGAQEDFSKAQKISIASLKENYFDSSIDDNLYIEGTVISDKDKFNIDEHYYHYDKDGSNFKAVIENVPLWLQDDSGAGICVEFLTAEDNVYPLGSHFKLHVTGMSISANEAGVQRLAGTLPDRVHDLTQQAVPEPVAVEDLSTIYKYEDCLVTLKDVQFAVPYGTYFNVDNRKVAENYTAYPEMLDATSRQHPHLLLDQNGNTIRLVSGSTFLDRHCRLMPQGTGDVTGIICRRASKEDTELYIRLRSDADNKVSATVTEQNAKIHVRFGPFKDVVDAEEVRANQGSATLKTSVFSNVTVASSSTSMYYVYSSIWLNPFENITVDVRSVTPAATNQYYSLNSQQWYNATGTSLTDCPGEAWIITTNTLNAGEGDLYIVMNNASYGNGPKDFTLEWAEDESAPIARWNKICDYQTCSWAANWQAGDFVFKLPDEVKGLDKVVFRHRVSTQESMSGPSKTIASTGTNRMNYWSMIEL